MGRQVGIYKDEGGWLRVAFPYDVAAKDALKEAAGKGGYRFIPENKTWYILEPMAQSVADAFIALGWEVETDLIASQDGSMGNGWDIILDGLSKETAAALYRGCAKVLHPDMPTGDAGMMTALNEAWQRRQARE